MSAVGCSFAKAHSSKSTTAPLELDTDPVIVSEPIMKKLLLNAMLPTNKQKKKKEKRRTK